MMLSLLQPRCVMPIHGEHRMLTAHARLAAESGVEPENIVVADNGTVVELTAAGVSVIDRAEAGITFVDGLGVGDVRDVSLRDRRRLSEHGVLIAVATIALDEACELGPLEVITRGLSELEPLVGETREQAHMILTQCMEDGFTDPKLLEEHLHDGLGKFIQTRIGRKPMILAVILEA